MMIVVVMTMTMMGILVFAGVLIVQMMTMMMENYWLKENHCYPIDQFR